MAGNISADDDGVTVLLSRRTLIQRLMSRFDGSRAEQELRFGLALADLNASAEEMGEPVEIAEDRIWIMHRTLAALPSDSADALSLPPLVDLTLRTGVVGVVGSSNFRLVHEWIRGGRPQSVHRTGAILQTSGAGAGGLRRVPLWMLDALEVSDGFRSVGSDGVRPDVPLDEHWHALARFRQALNPADGDGDAAVGRAPDAADRLEMTQFLDGLRVTVADRFSISPDADALDIFEIVPFSGHAVESAEFEGRQIDEGAAEVTGANLRKFQDLVRERGARGAYRLDDDSYLVIAPSAAPVLRLMSEMQNADPDVRLEFVQNPRRRISEVYAQQLRERGDLEGLSPAEEEELIDQVSEPAFVETREYSERVIGVTIYEPPSIELAGEGTTWLPEVFEVAAAEVVERLSPQRIEKLMERVEEAIKAGKEGVEEEGQVIPANNATVFALKARLVEIREDDSSDPEGSDPSGGGRGTPGTEGTGESPRPIILDTKTNYEVLRWAAKIQPRVPFAAREVPNVVRTELRPHQLESFHWKVDAWATGLPGVLNADEQGLGKTLQAICFLAWMKENMAKRGDKTTGPVLIVAPTTLLENWENEVDRHLASPGLGNVVRLYGAGISVKKKAGEQGIETQSGKELLDFSEVREAIADGRGHRYWVLTTYTTLTSYQHSLASIPFSTAVFDEIQELKNPATMRSRAALAVNAEFRIGLTGTPIENSTTDLWAIMEQLNPGRIGVLRDFRTRFGKPDDNNMSELHSLTFRKQGDLPAVAIRRLKEDAAQELPEKRRFIHPRPMPEKQAVVYEAARGKLAEGTRGSALKMLRHIRSVSVHPDAVAQVDDEEFIAMSARLQAVFDLLRKIKDYRERALVFIENIWMQHRFIDLVKREFGLSEVDLINGNTPIRRRQEIVDRFQDGLKYDVEFGVLVLAPKAAGTGLTLTAATHVIHLSRWWNPAVEEQCNDRVHRIGQTRPVTVHVPMAVHPGRQHNSFDCLLHSLMVRKRRLATAALWPMGDTREDTSQLQQMLSEEEAAASGDPVGTAMVRMFERDQLPLPERNPDGSMEYL